MRTGLALLVCLVALAWGWDVLSVAAPAGATGPWILRQQGLYLSGLLSIALMSLAMLLATRPVWLEGPLGGLDRVYRTHKWAAILAGVSAVLHWSIELSSDLLKALIGRAGRWPKENYSGWHEGLRDLAKDFGEWAIYAVLAMLLLTLWRRFPYRQWRILHRLMPLLYLALAFHAVLLAPAGYWRQPVGLLLALLIGGGVYGSVCSLRGRIGRARQFAGEILAVTPTAPDVLGVRCRLDGRWPGHRPGQFAFVSFADGEGQHPFTIAGADRGDREVSFAIKALGDYTSRLRGRLAAGQPVTVEGPYGRFDYARRDVDAEQIWIAAGIGVTPFLAWLEALQARPEDAPAAELHYCSRDAETDPFVTRLKSLCSSLPTIHLQLHGARQGQPLGAALLIAGKDDRRPVEVWFCGPPGLADALRHGLRVAWRGRLSFHQEAFVMR